MRLAIMIICLIGIWACPATAQDMRRRVISGDRIVVQGVEIQLRDTECPAETTAEGREAKRIMNIMLFARKLECSYDKKPDGNVGDCIYGPSAGARVGRSMADELKRRNLCQPYGRT
ncbi:hypothetical protein [Pseudooceanicola onchidii]|uniref:hypothetical protein n=1 Tax=Pseudooceanicola onchidii TaxID=2562279 RepID=UPI0010A9CFF4|nr:hypothetical protein [Pseudooceanicola onchidii]